MELLKWSTVQHLAANSWSEVYSVQRLTGNNLASILIFRMPCFRPAFKLCITMHKRMLQVIINFTPCTSALLADVRNRSIPCTVNSCATQILTWHWSTCVQLNSVPHDAVEAHSCVDIVAKFTAEQYTTINQSTAGHFDPRVFVNCLQVSNSSSQQYKCTAYLCGIYQYMIWHVIKKNILYRADFN